jgi:GTPase SAR1 family protein
MDNSQIKIAIVGMTGAGKTVLISTLAMKMSQMADQGIFLAPMGNNRRQTLRYVQENWQTLNSGKWPPSTPAGELIHLEWELTTKENSATVRFADCAGQDIHTIFSQEQFDYSALTLHQKYIFDYLRSANILIFLVNMEDVLGRSPKQALENSLDVDQMFYVLNQKADFPRKTALVLSQFDKYRDELKAKYDNNLLEYLRANFPQLHGRYIQNPNFAVIPVAAVETTRTIIDNGTAKQVPVENFSSFNLKKLISWIGGAVDELAPSMPKVTTRNTFHNENLSDEENEKINAIFDEVFNKKFPKIFNQGVNQQDGNVHNNVTIHIDTPDGNYSYSTNSSTKNETHVNGTWSSSSSTSNVTIINDTSSKKKVNPHKEKTHHIETNESVTPFEIWTHIGCSTIFILAAIAYLADYFCSPENSSTEKGVFIAMIAFIVFMLFIAFMSMLNVPGSEKYKKKPPEK